MRQNYYEMHAGKNFLDRQAEINDRTRDKTDWYGPVLYYKT